MKSSRVRTLVFFGSALALFFANLASVAQDTRPESNRPSPIPLEPSAGSKIGLVYEAYLSPQQEGGEESETPALIPPEFRSVGSSVPREQRPSRGQAVLEFARDLSKVYVHLSLKGVKLEEVNMLHLHCGRPGQLGPILVDFSLIGDLKKYLADGMLNIEVTNTDISNTLAHGHGVLAAFTVGCPIVPTIPQDRVKTIAGMETIARQGELYFNLHTTAQTYFGDIRGQFYPVVVGTK